MLKKLSHYIDFNEPAQTSTRRESQKVKTLNESFDFLSLIKSWREIAGDKLSEHTIPLKNQSGTLVVLSNHSAFANELSFMELPLKKKIFAKFPSLDGSIKNIKFIVDSTHFEKQYALFIAPNEKIKNQNAQKLHPYSPLFRKLKKEAEAAFLDIEDLELKNSLISLYIQSGGREL